MLNRVEEATVVAKQAQAKGLDSTFGTVHYAIAFYREDTAEMARQLARFAGRPGEEDVLFAMEADTVAYSGHLGKAREFSRRAADSAERAGEKETAATYRAVSAFREALFGNVAIAREQTAVGKGGSSGRDLDYALALGLVYSGELNRRK